MVRNSIRPKALFTATAIALAMSGGVWAQAANDSDNRAPATQGVPMPGDAAQNPAPADRGASSSGQPALAEQGQPPAAEAATEPAPAEGIITAQADGQALASDLLGATVMTPNGEDLGKLDDLIVDREGKVQGAVLSVGGFLGIGDKRIAVPWQTVQQGGPDWPLVVAMGKDQLEAAPEFVTLADQQAQRQAAAAPPPAAVPAPAPGAGSQ